MLLLRLLVDLFRGYSTVETGILENSSTLGYLGATSYCCLKSVCLIEIWMLLIQKKNDNYYLFYMKFENNNNNLSFMNNPLDYFNYLPIILERLY